MNSAPYKIKRLLLLPLLVSTIWTSAQAATLTATVNRNQVTTNETLQLKVSYDEQVSSSALDLRALEGDFEVLGVSPQTNSSVSVVNGQTTRQSSVVWNITLVPKRQGQLTIPAFAINNDRSQAITISVDNSQQGNSASLPLQVWVSTNYNSIYPAQQLVVEVEISALSNISDLNGPSLIVQGANVEALDQQSFQRIDNGVARQVVVLKYAVFAEQEGELIIPVMTFTGVKNGRRSIFGTRGEQVIARSKQLIIPIKPAPVKAGSQWFPAEAVEIRAGWSGDTAQLKVGEPITRTITITTRGQRAEVIPPVTESATGSAEYKLYADQAQLESKATTDGFVSTRIESAAIVPAMVPADGGKIILPALSLDWWDVGAKRWKQATYPAQTLVVTSSGAVIEENQATSTETDIVGATDQAVALVDDRIRLWQAITAGLLLLCLIQFAMILRLRKNQTSTPKRVEPLARPSEKSAWSQLQKSLRAEDTVAIRSNLIRWLRTITTPTMQQASLQALLVEADNPDLSAAVHGLEAFLYKAGPDIDLKQMINIVDAHRNQVSKNNKANNSQAGELKPLYSAAK
ncbi:MAG: BatD family protein [Pseudomonadota bacterium]